MKTEIPMVSFWVGGFDTIRLSERFVREAETKFPDWNKGPIPRWADELYDSIEALGQRAYERGLRLRELKSVAVLDAN